MAAEHREREEPAVVVDEPLVEEQSEPLDIYALLGVTSDVTPGLARQMYWIRVERYQQAQQGGDADAPRKIEELNEALAIILDDRRRAQYDREHRRTRTSATETAARFDRARRTRAGAVLALMLITVGGALFAAWQYTPIVVAGVVSIGLLTVITAVSWPRRDAIGGRSAFTLLGLTEEATQRDVDIAYETLAQELLSRVKYDPGAIGRLELLDRAYLRAARLVEERSGEAGTVERGRMARFASFLGRWLLRMLGVLVVALGVLALTVLKWLGNLVVRLLGTTGRRVRATSVRGARRTAEQLSLLSRHITGEEEEDLPTIEIDVDRRVASGLRHVAQRAAFGPVPSPVVVAQAEQAAEAIEPAAADDELVEAYLVLEASAGERRVPIRSAPLRIGSSDECDLALPADLGVAPEHVLVWQRAGALLLHVIDPGAGNCLVDDRPMTWATLEHGDTIRLGEARFRVEVPST